MAGIWLSFRIFHLNLVISSLALSNLVISQCDIPPLTLVWSNITVTQDGLGVTRGIELGIGSPYQIFSFRPSTTLNNTRINNVLNCGSAGATNNTCIGSLGGGFDLSQSETFMKTIKDQWNGSAIDDENDQSAYLYFNDNVGFQRQGDAIGFPLVMESGEFMGTQSGLPLGTNSSFLSAAVEGGVAPSQVFGLWPGSRGIDPRDGMLIIGGYDQARVNSSSDFTTFPVGNWSLERACPLQVTITGISYANVPLMDAASDAIVACIEPSAQRFFFPPTVATNFALCTGQDETLFPNKMHYDVLNRPTGDLKITLSSGYEAIIPNEELFAPLRGSDKNGRFAITNDSVVEAFVADTRDENPNDVDVTLGAMFLTFNYLMVDYANSEFKLAPAVTADLQDVPPNPTTICTPTPDTPQGPSIPSPSAADAANARRTAAIAGGVAGGVGGVALIGGLAFFVLRRRRRRSWKSVSEMSGTISPPIPPPPPPPPPAPPVLQTHRHQISEVAGSMVIHELPATRLSSVRKSRVEMRNGHIYT